MTGRTNTGGGALGAQKKGTIVVNYPIGSTCTVTNGSKTYTALDTSGAAAFVVETGTWTVRAYGTGGDKSASVSVAAAGWVNVEIVFTQWLYDAGNEFTEATGGWGWTGGGGTLKRNADNFYATTGTAYTNNSFDLTGVSTIYFEAHATSTASNLSWIGASQVQNGEFLAKTFLPAGTRAITSADVSALTGMYYPSFHSGSASAGVYVYRIWME